MRSVSASPDSRYVVSASKDCESVEDIPVLLRCGSALLQPFFEVLMQLPYFTELPIVLY